MVVGRPERRSRRREAAGSQKILGNSEPLWLTAVLPTGSLVSCSFTKVPKTRQGGQAFRITLLETACAVFSGGTGRSGIDPPVIRSGLLRVGPYQSEVDCT